MGIFIFMYLGFIGFNTVSKRYTGEARQRFMWLSGFLVLWLIQALRAETVGTDLVLYIPDFLHHKSELRFEIGFALLQDILRNTTESTSVYLATISFIILLPITILYREYSKSIFLSYIIFSSLILYHFTFSGLRQAVALGVIAFSYRYIVQRQLFRFIICVALAACFHVSAVIFFISYPFCNNIKMTKNKYLLYGIIGLFIIFSLKPILSILLPIIFGDGKYTGYVSNEVSASYNLFILFILFFYWTFVVKNPSENLKNYRKFLFILIFCQSLGFISQVATRIGYYFMLFLPLAIPEIIDDWKIRKKNKSYIKGGVILFMIFFFFYSNGSGYLDVIPYSFFWEN